MNANFFSRLIAPGNAGLGFELPANLGHFEIHDNVFPVGLRAENVQGRAAFADVVKHAVAVGTGENYIKTRRDRTARVRATIAFVWRGGVTVSGRQ